MKRLLRALLVFVALLLALAAASPGLIYLAELSQIHGRPQPEGSPPLSVEQQNWLRCELAASDEERPPVTNPWQLAVHFLREDTMPGYADKMAWLAARDYLPGHIEHPGGAEWTLSGMALTVWVARHWSTPQLEARAHAVLQHVRGYRCAPGPGEWPPPGPLK